MKEISCKKEPEKLKEIRDELLAGNPVKVFNKYETIYGADFERWLLEGIKDIPCEIEVTSWNRWYDYPWSYKITPKAKSNE